jgi:ribonuclease HI
VVSPEARVYEPVCRRNPGPSPILFDDPTPLDLLLKEVLAHSLSAEQALKQLYGPVYTNNKPVVVYIATSMKGHRAAFALWWGEQSARNCAYVLGDRGSDAKACLMAVLSAARSCLRERRLIIHTSSQYVIRSLCYWAGNNATYGWTCINGDEMELVTAWIAQREAPTEFRWLSSSHPAPPMQKAKASAKAAVTAMDTPVFTCPARPDPVPADPKRPIVDVPKVETQLPEVPEPAVKEETVKIDLKDVVDSDEGHRGRERYGVMLSI